MVKECDEFQILAIIWFFFSSSPSLVKDLMKIIAIRILVNVHRNINFAPSDVNISLNGCALSRMTIIAILKYFGLVLYARVCHCNAT